ncbi:MAG: GntR family transcriptional regulator, partial [Mycobacterium sp.]
AVSMWRDKAATRLVHKAEAVYTRNRERLRAALAERGVASHGRSGLNIWIPVPDETVAITRLLNAGWAAAPGTRFRIGTPPGMRITVSSLDVTEIEGLADAVAEALHAVGRVSV